MTNNNSLFWLVNIIPHLFLFEKSLIYPLLTDLPQTNIEKD